jgi:hypothetical protein
LFFGFKEGALGFRSALDRYRFFFPFLSGVYLVPRFNAVICVLS